MFLLDGKPLPLDVPFETGGIRYPANWLRLTTPEEREALGITEVAEQPRPDDRFYWVTDNGDGTYTATPKPVPDVQAMLIGQCESYAFTTLSQSDWMVVRHVETGKPADPKTTQYRSDVRAAFEKNKSAVLACTTVEELQALVLLWPDFDSTVVATPVEEPAPVEEPVVEASA